MGWHNFKWVLPLSSSICKSTVRACSQTYRTWLSASPGYWFLPEPTYSHLVEFPNLLWEMSTIYVLVYLLFLPVLVGYWGVLLLFSVYGYFMVTKSIVIELIIILLFGFEVDSTSWLLLISGNTEPQPSMLEKMITGKKNPNNRWLTFWQHWKMILGKEHLCHTR